MEAKCFADYMRIHALEATGGKTYSQMPQYATDDGKGTSDKAAATKGPNGAPVSNPARQIWVTQTALATALNVSFFAEGVALFAIVVGIALLLVGIGFLVMVSVSRRREGAAAEPRRPRPRSPPDLPSTPPGTSRHARLVPSPVTETALTALNTATSVVCRRVVSCLDAT